VGNPATFAFPVRYHVVRQATPERVVEQAAEGLLDRFVAGARALEAAGARAIATTCGFLVLHQNRLAAAVRVPVLTSSLLQYPLVRAVRPPDRRVGIVTASARHLTDAHLAAAGIARAEVAIAGLETTRAFYPAIVGNQPSLDVDAVRAEVVAATRALAATNSDLGAIIFECANLGPYRAHAEQAVGLPIFDAVGLIEWLYRGVLSP